MSSQTLREARKTEEIMAKQIGPLERPAFHLTPQTGWMNDPNGFCWHDGMYHMFYQYNPYSSHWDSMHWGHAVSRDLLHWEFLPAALAPDELYDCDGCFSGSAMTLDDGRLLLMYTGVRNERGQDGRTVEIQTQNIAIGDGVDFEKIVENPVLDEKDLPEGASRNDFRDPKIIRREDGTYAALIGSRPADGSGQILIYTSSDCIHWTYEGKLAENRCRFGKMWECPDFFRLDGKDVLLTSPQDMLPEGFEYHNGNGTLCLIGKVDEKTHALIEEHNQSIDYGIDYYAPQTVLTPDGRRVMIGWMQNWDTLPIREPHEKWAGQMSLPRELSVKDGRLWQKPLRELEDYRTGEVSVRGMEVSGESVIENVRGRTIDMELTIRRCEDKENFDRFSLWFAMDDKFHTSLSYRPRERTLKIDRKFSGSRRAIIHQRRALVDEKDGALKLRLILDRYSVEVFVNDGEQVMSAALYTPLEADAISFRCDGKCRIDLKKWDLVL